MTDEIIYREFHSLRWLVWGLAATSLGAIAVAAATGYAFGGWLALVGIFGLFLVQFPAGIHRMNRIVLTPHRLVVGTEQFRPADFDLVFGVQPALVLAPEEQRRIESDMPLPSNHHVRIAGGSWGRRIGTSMLVLREADGGRLVALFTRHPWTMDRLLTEWLERIPEPTDRSTAGGR